MIGEGPFKKEGGVCMEDQKIMNTYTRMDFDWLPLKRYGETILSITYTDPYACYIARKLERYEKSETFTYTLMDLNGERHRGN